MALVPASRPPVQAPEDSIVLYGSSGHVGEPLEQKLARLRSDREAHSRKQIWTKDAHGGPYKKVIINEGYDPLLQLPDGTDRKVDLGYERVKTGPTSNFVGNHMTQGAIDLVQAQLEAPAAHASAQLLLGTAAADAARQRQQPRLLGAAEAAEAAEAAVVALDGSRSRPRPIQQYSWVDAGGTVGVEVPVAQLQLGGGAAAAEVVCEIRPDRLDLNITVSGPQAKASDSSSYDGSSSMGQPGSHPDSQVMTAHQLQLHPLLAPVLPSRSRCFVRGPPLLPPCQDSSSSRSTTTTTTTKHGGEAGLVATEEGEELEQGQQQAQGGGPAQAQVQAGQAGQALLRVRFTMPPSATAVAVQLAKADPRQQWDVLQAPLALPLVRSSAREGGAGGAGGAPPDMSALRKAVRQQLGRVTAPAAVPAPATPSGAANPDHSRTTPAPAGAAAEAAEGAETGAACPLDAEGTCRAALQEAEALVLAGRHAEALQRTAACLPQLADGPMQALAVPCQLAGGSCQLVVLCQLAVQVHALRARCYSQLGCLKQAVAEYSAAIQVLQGQAAQGQATLGAEPRQEQGQQQQQQGREAELCRLLLGRAAVYEQQERLEEALADVDQAAKVQQKLPAAALLTAQRLRQACRHGRQAGRGPTGVTTVP